MHTTSPPLQSDASADHRNGQEKSLKEPFLCKPGMPDKPESPPSYEDLQTIIGSSGIWQLKIFLLASFSGFCTSMHNMIYAFVGVVPDHKCALPNVPLNMSRDELRHLLTSGISEEDQKCLIHPWTLDNSSEPSLIVQDSLQERCSSYDFDHSEFQSTIPTQWHLVCEDATWAPFIQVTYMTGLVVGAPIFGAISDRLGRKSAVLIATLIFALTGPLIAFSPNFFVLLTLRFILALALPGVYACSYVLSIEVISERWRSLAGNFFNLPFALGYTVMPIVAYFVRSWKTLQILCSLPSLALILTWWLLPESPRWLIRKGKLEDAERILRVAAKVNKTEGNIPEDFGRLIWAIYNQERESEEERTIWGGIKHAISDYFEIIKSPRMRSLFLTLCFCWCIIGMTYYGLGLNSSNLNTDRYTYTFIAGLLEFPAYMMVPLFIKYFGRKVVFIGFMWTCGSALLVSLFLPKGSVGIVLLSFLGKLVIGANYSLVYLYSSELLPTLVRNCALGVCSMVGRVGSTIAPFIVDIVGAGHHKYPCLIFGCLAVFAGCLSLILPETRDRRLPETIEEVELGSGIKAADSSIKKKVVSVKTPE